MSFYSITWYDIRSRDVDRGEGRGGALDSYGSVSYGGDAMNYSTDVRASQVNTTRLPSNKNTRQVWFPWALDPP